MQSHVPRLKTRWEGSDVPRVLRLCILSPYGEAYGLQRVLRSSVGHRPQA
jgi:hypothetical protein